MALCKTGAGVLAKKIHDLAKQDHQKLIREIEFRFRLSSVYYEKTFQEQRLWLVQFLIIFVAFACVMSVMALVFCVLSYTSIMARIKRFDDFSIG